MTVRSSSLGVCVAAISASLVLFSAPAAAAGAEAAVPSPTPTMAAVGSVAPAVTGASTFAGKTEQFDLSKAVTHGAVVLYFFPKAFTAG
jgi:peroxiredoxin Q/BCP